MKKKTTLSIPEEPFLDFSDEETRVARRKRIAWILGAAAALIVLLFWGVRQSKPKPSVGESASQGENSPDAVIEKFHMISSVQGQKRWIMDADKARFYQNQKMAYADEIYAQYIKNGKIVSTLTAEQAIINTETDATQAVGHVELIVENGSKLETDKLSWDPETDLIKTDSRVHIYKGMDDITATGLTADTQLNNVVFKKDVQTKVKDTGEIENFGNPKKF